MHLVYHTVSLQPLLKLRIVSFFLFSLSIVGFANAQPEVILQGTAKGRSLPILLFQGAVSADSQKLDWADDANSWANKLTHALDISGAVKVTQIKPDSLVPGILIPNAKLEVKKASVGGAVTVSLYAGDGIKPYWNQSFTMLDKPVDYTLPAASSLQMQLTGEPGFATARVYFAGVTEPGNRELFSANIYGQQVRQHTTDHTILLSPNVSPDGSKVAYVSFKGGNADIWMETTSGGKADVLLATPYLDSSPAFAPDGKRVAYASSETGNMEVFSISVNSTEKTQLTFSGGIDTSPSWSPAGDRIVFTSDRSGSPQVYSMANDGTDVRRITFEGEYNDSPCWSPKGDKIVYLRREDGIFRLYACDPAGVAHKRLLEYSYDQKDPAFVPGGARVSFVTVWHGQPGIALLTPETGEVDLIVSGFVAQKPAWGPPQPQ